MRRKNNAGIPAIQLFSEEKLAEFKHMSLRARLQWLDEANALVNKAARAKISKSPGRPS
jgi:hypothetical protein